MSAHTNRLKGRLDQQLRFLTRSCLLYDSGADDEVVRIATTLRVLLHHDTESLLVQLGVRDRIQYFVTPEEAERWPFAPLCLFSTSATIDMEDQNPEPNWAGYSPRYDYVAPGLTRRGRDEDLYPRRFWQTLLFKDWWEAPVTFSRARVPQSRGQIVKMIANKEGGAHVAIGDNDLTATQKELIHHQGGFQAGLFNGEVPLTPPLEVGPQWATLRQIAFELQLSLSDQQIKIGQGVPVYTPPPVRGRGRRHASSFVVTLDSPTGDPVIDQMDLRTRFWSDRFALQSAMFNAVSIPTGLKPFAF